MQIYTIAKNVLGALGSKVKVPVLDAELKLPAECMRIVGALDAGAIIESGENANGRYVKWADGTLICTHIYTGVPYHSDYLFNTNKWVVPVAFVRPIFKMVVSCDAQTKDNVTNNNRVYTGIAYQEGVTYIWNTGTNSAHQVTAGAIRGGGRYSVESYAVSLLAVGRWK